MNLNDKVCLITGAARGIGAAIAKRYVKAGASRYCDLQPEAAQETAASSARWGRAARSAWRWMSPVKSR